MFKRSSQFSIRYLFCLTGIIGVALLPLAYGGLEAIFVVISVWLGILGLAALHAKFGLTALVLAAGLFGACLLPGTGGHVVARRTQCQSYMRQITLAILNYESEHGHFPPPYVADENGEPMHSWRVLILPYLEEQELYDQFDFSKPWNDPVNLRLASKMPSIYRCPSDQLPATDVTTSYLAVVGQSTAWPTSGKRTFDDVTDGLSKTLLLVESTEARMHWMAPMDISLESVIAAASDPSKPGISSNHVGNISIMTFCDCRVIPVPSSLGVNTLRAMLTCNGDETWEFPRR